METLLSMMNVSLWSGVCYIAKMAAKILLVAAVVFLGVAIPDYFVQKKQFMESMKMTKQEVKQEYKDMEGDPLVKSRLRQQMRNLLYQNLPKAVSEADVVITNPTHYAVAVKYDKNVMQAPIVNAKGETVAKIEGASIGNDGFLNKKTVYKMAEYNDCR